MYQIAKIVIGIALLVSLVPVTGYSQDLNSELHRAAEEGDPIKVKALLAQGADVNAKDTYGWRTALMFAAQKGHAEVVRLLKQADAVKTPEQVPQRPVQRGEVLDSTKEIEVENGLHLVLKVDCSRFSSGAHRDVVQMTAKIIARRLFLFWSDKKNSVV